MAVRICQSEVNQLHMPAVVRNNDVRGFQVAVDDAFRMDIGYSIRHLLHHPEPHPARRLFCQPLLECHAIDILHHDAASQAFNNLYAVSRYHIRMLQQHQYLQLLA